MAHSRLALTTMLDWIEQCLTGDAALPTDAEIMERYGFASAEHARTLLAELADAGKITIRGYGADRVILLGRVKSAVVPAPRAAPAVRKVDPEVDRAVVKIRDIITRQAPAAVQIVAANAHALLAAVNPPPAAQTPPLKKEKAMPGPKSIQLPASAPKAIEAIERLAKRADISLGAAAAQLIERGLSADVPTTTEVGAVPTLDDVIEMMRAAFAAPDALAAALSDESAALAIEREARVAAEQRATAAEDRIAQMKALFA